MSLSRLRGMLFRIFLNRIDLSRLHGVVLKAVRKSSWYLPFHREWPLDLGMAGLD
jgi:hypothetical protein